MHIRTSIALAALLMLGVLSCGLDNKSDAMGENDIITIIADSSDFELLSDVIENAFARPFFTPQPESWFRWKRYDLADLLDHKRDRNILIIAPLDGKNSMGEYMRSALDTSVQALVREGAEHVFVKKDFWYREQTVMHLTGKSMQDLRNFMAENAQQLEFFFKQAWDERELARLRALPREEEIEERLLSEHGFTLAVIKSWFIAKDSAEIRSVLLRRQAPKETERWLMVHWLDTTNTALLTNEFAYQTRNRLTETLYRTYDDAAWVVVDSVNHLQFDEVNFQGRYAIRMKGLWRMSDYSMGGPFISYLFFDESQKRLYLVDGSVFAPRYEKRKLIQDIEVMIRSFRTAGSKDKQTAS